MLTIFQFFERIHERLGDLGENLCVLGGEAKFLTAKDAKKKDAKNARRGTGINFETSPFIHYFARSIFSTCIMFSITCPLALTR